MPMRQTIRLLWSLFQAAVAPITLCSCCLALIVISRFECDEVVTILVQIVGFLLSVDRILCGLETTGT